MTELATIALWLGIEALCADQAFTHRTVPLHVPMSYKGLSPYGKLTLFLCQLRFYALTVPSVEVAGQPQQHRHGQQRMTTTQSKRLLIRLHGKQRTSASARLLSGLAPSKQMYLQLNADCRASVRIQEPCDLRSPYTGMNGLPSSEHRHSQAYLYSNPW